MADQLPTFPRLLFTIIEPISLYEAGSNNPSPFSTSIPDLQRRMDMLPLSNNFRGSEKCH